MTNWKYTDSTHKIVSRVLSDGTVESCDVSVISEWLAEGNTPEPVDPPTPEQIMQECVDGVQNRLDTFARTRNYDGILSLCTYATDANPQFAAEGQYGVTARSQHWNKLYEIMAEVQGGTRPLPSGYADIESELPVLEWPVL